MKLRPPSPFIALIALASFSLLNLLPATASAQGATAFTYQGQLRDGGINANGTYTMVFALFDAAGGGNQVGSANTTSPALANGLFSVNLDFGAGAFNGTARWLDITITQGLTTQTLSPRVQVLPAPYAQFATVAATVTNGAIMNAQLAANAVSTADIQNNAITTTQIADGAVVNRNLAASAVNAANIAGGQVVKTLNGLSDGVSLSAGANAALFTSGNALQISAGVPNIQVFSSSGTFVVPSNVTKIMVELWGGGGAGGAGFLPVNGTLYAGGGGGSGAYAFNVFTVTPGANYTVTVGGGGAASSFAALISAGGGSPGSDATASGPGAGGRGGVTSGSLLPIIGNPGQSGSTDNSNLGGNGGSAPRGGSGGWGNQDQKDGQFGAGGGGGAPNVQNGAGGRGGQGGVIVHY